MTRMHQATAARLEMPKSRKDEPWRTRLLKVLTSWNRNQVGRVIALTLLIWLIGALVLLVLEGGRNPNFVNLPEALWSVWVLLFSGPGITRRRPGPAA